MLANNRRYDIDWLRVIAISLLLVYHVAIAFQPWGIMIGFITNSKPLPGLWAPMTMLNVWRIPLLFFISGMGVYFAMQNRNWKQVLFERSQRIGIPFLFDFFVLVPLQLMIWQYYYRRDFVYYPNPAHLWFLGNIFIYVLLLLPVFFFLKRKEKGQTVRRIKKLFGHPLSFLLVVLVFVAETITVKPFIYEMYAMTWHGFFLGLTAFVFGFCFMLAGQAFWSMLQQWRWLFFTLSIGFYTWRLIQSPISVPHFQLAIESCCWIFTVFAFGNRYLNKPGSSLQYWSQAAYPVYILHMVFLFLGSVFLFPLAIPAYLKFILLLALTAGGSIAAYELVIRRIGVLRLLFGVKSKARRI